MLPTPPCGENGTHTYCHPSLFEGAPDRLYRNNGDGTFTDVSQAAGVGGIGGMFHGKGLGVISADFNNDGAPDLYVANDDTRNDFFYNNGDGTFSEISLLAGWCLQFQRRSAGGYGPLPSVTIIRTVGLIFLSRTSLMRPMRSIGTTAMAPSQT